MRKLVLEVQYLMTVPVATISTCNSNKSMHASGLINSYRDLQ